ncbi:acylphosphatase [Bacillus sp. FJAT-27225]|uniref:acylphosphatase n=1 Tax=Bacillus sp. FJAT-27225 TaxID=1743144 RepID=UPI00080C326A|nr:acylphosphatase [Bacillus sp. FJAT-27225]OCA85776.1 acylphosphatase [Bacillus sp. FJAT-27225]
MKLLKKLRDGYVMNHANRTKLPVFHSGNIVRRKVQFSGRVQKVGFRLELACLAERLGLAGWVRNKEDESVEAELQGEDAKIDFLITCMKSLKRAAVKEIIVTELAVEKEDKTFKIVK